MGISNNQATIGSATLSAPVSHKRKQLFVLTASTLAFTVCFMAWMMFGVIGIPIKKASARAPAQLVHEECSRYYALHPELFTSGDLVFARHILFAVTPGAPVGLLRDQAEKVLHEARAHPERFSALATQYSNCPSAQQDGSLGQLGRGDCVPEFEQALFDGRRTGILPRLINTRFGFHIVAVDQRVPGRSLPYEAVREQIAAAGCAGTGDGAHAVRARAGGRVWRRDPRRRSGRFTPRAVERRTHDNR